MGHYWDGSCPGVYLVFIFLFAFFQYPSHKGNSATMVGMVLWAATGLFTVFYFMVERVKFKLKYLRILGRNPLICYIFILLYSFIVADMILDIDAGDLVNIDLNVFGSTLAVNGIPFSIANLCALGLILLPLGIISLICYGMYKGDVKVSG